MGRERNSEGGYDAGHISRYFDDFGEREWERLEADAPARVSLHLHTRFLEKYIKPGDAVLEAGAGAGRFTLELARLGAEVTVGDVSPEQVRLNRKKVEEAGFAGSVSGWEVMDITDLSRFPSESFDSVVCYGDPLSYVFDRADEAMEEMLRLTKPGGRVLLSVMSLAGATRRFLGAIYDLRNEAGEEVVQQVVETGDQREEAAPNGHFCRMYFWRDLETLLKNHECEIVDASSSNFLSVQNEAVLEEVREDARFWETLLEWEERCCRQPGVLDGGTHIIAVVEKL